MWSSSSMRLPEHVLQILEQNKEIKKLTKPELDEQEIVTIDQAIYGSMKQNRVVTLTTFNEYKHNNYRNRTKGWGIKEVQVLFWEPFDLEDEMVFGYAWEDILKAELREVEE
jgi:hypothetical protein